MATLVLITIGLLIAIIMYIIVGENSNAIAYILLLMAFVFVVGYKIGYKDGQVDVLGKGEIKYHLLKHDDGSTSWKHINE